MSLNKICPTCKKVNPAENPLCDFCMADIASIEPSSGEEKPPSIVPLPSRDGGVPGAQKPANPPDGDAFADQPPVPSQHGSKSTGKRPVSGPRSVPGAIFDGPPPQAILGGGKSTFAGTPQSPADPAVTVVQRRVKIRLKLENFEFEIEDGDVVGRGQIGKEILTQFPGISRKHARFSYENGNWFVEDLQSTNGTYVNGTALKPGQKYAISPGDKLGISRKVAFEILPFKPE